MSGEPQREKRCLARRTGDGRPKYGPFSLFFLAQLPTVCDILAYVQLPRFAVATRKIGLALCMTRRPLGCGANFDMSNQSLKLLAGFHKDDVKLYHTHL